MNLIEECQKIADEASRPRVPATPRQWMLMAWESYTMAVMCAVIAALTLVEKLVQGESR